LTSLRVTENRLCTGSSPDRKKRVAWKVVQEVSAAAMNLGLTIF
jgi:hypothetical protein